MNNESAPGIETTKLVMLFASRVCEGCVVASSWYSPWEGTTPARAMLFKTETGGGTGLDLATVQMWIRQELPGSQVQITRLRVL